MMNRLMLPALVLALLGGAAPSFALSTPDDGEEAVKSPRETVERGFRGAPEVGEPLPHVAGYDSDGRPFRLASLKGSHTVIVFGCLT